VVSAMAPCRPIWRAEKGFGSVAHRLGMYHRSGGGDVTLTHSPPLTETTSTMAAACSRVWPVAACEVDAQAVGSGGDAAAGSGGGAAAGLEVRRRRVLEMRRLSRSGGGVASIIF
jgi:hypothetical protein